MAKNNFSRALHDQYNKGASHGIEAYDIITSLAIHNINAEQELFSDEVEAKLIASLEKEIVRILVEGRIEDGDNCGERIVWYARKILEEAKKDETTKPV